MKATYVNVTDLRDNLADWIDLVRYKGESLNIMRRGKVVALMLPKQRDEDNYAKVVKKAAGVFSAEKHPEWSGLDDIVKWVNKGRKLSERYSDVD
jgi:antitoxin (DNA-binding transcriptional repressor) of toxin-antitoxin stability system